MKREQLCPDLLKACLKASHLFKDLLKASIKFFTSKILEISSHGSWQLHQPFNRFKGDFRQGQGKTTII